MSTKPHHRRPITVEIPVTWTPEQALAAFELIDELRETIWARHGSQMQVLMAEQPQARRSVTVTTALFRRAPPSGHFDYLEQ